MTATALESRLRRALAREGRRLVKPRSERDRQQVGDLYVVDTMHNCVVASHCTVEGLAAELSII